MTQYKKGFILPLVLIVVGLVVVGGGVYYSLQNETLLEDTSGQSDTDTSVVVDDTNESDEPEDTPEPTTVTLKTYTNVTNGFKVEYPEELAVSEVSSYGVLKAGTSFVFPASYKQNTNLSDGRIHIETQTTNGTCSASSFISVTGKESKVLPSVLKNNMVFTAGMQSEVAAGSTYTQTVYSTGAKGKCYGIILYTRAGNLGAYDPSVKAYDAVKINAVFEGMISTFNVL